MATMSQFPSDWTVEQQDISRQRKMADILREQSMQAPQGQMIGNQFVAPSMTQGLARVLQSYMGAKLNKDLDAKERGIYQAQRTQGAQDMSSMIDALRGTPAVAKGFDGNNDDLGSAGVPAVAPDANKAMSIGMGSQHPMANALAAKLMEQQFKPAEGVNINGQLVNKFTGAPMGSQIPKQGEAFTLGDTRYDANGKPIVNSPDLSKPFTRDGLPNIPVQRFEMSKSKAGASTVNVAAPENKYNQIVGEGLGKEGLALVDAAKAAPEVVRNAQMIRAALDKGAITGTGAETRLSVQKALETAGVVGKGKAASTEELMAGLGKLTLAGIKTSGLGAGNGFTNADREFLSSAISGQISGTKENLKRVADLSERVAIATHQKGQKVLERWSQNPALKGVAQDTSIDPLPNAAVEVDY